MSLPMGRLGQHQQPQQRPKAPAMWRPALAMGAACCMRHTAVRLGLPDLALGAMAGTQPAPAELAAHGRVSPAIAALAFVGPPRTALRGAAPAAAPSQAVRDHGADVGGGVAVKERQVPDERPEAQVAIDPPLSTPSPPTTSPAALPTAPPAGPLVVTPSATTPPSQQEGGPGLLLQLGAVAASFAVGLVLGISGPPDWAQLKDSLGLQGVVSPKTAVVAPRLAAEPREVPQQQLATAVAAPAIGTSPASSSSAPPPKREPERALQVITQQDDKIVEWYTRVMETAREAGAKVQKAMQQKGGGPQLQGGQQEKEAPSRVAPSIVKKIRSIADILDEAQDDVYNELWISLESLPQQMQAFIPLLEYYADTAFPDGGDSSQRMINVAQRDALRFEAVRMQKGIMKLDIAVKNKKVRAVEEAFATTSLAYDRFLKAGDLYTGYDPVTSTTVFFNAVYDKGLQYTPVALEQPRIRDEVLVLQGPDKGKVGRVIWLGRENPNDLGSRPLTAVVKLDPNPLLGTTSMSIGVREVKAYPYSWIVQTRSSTQSFTRDFVLATLAAVVSCGLTYPLENLKTRVQLNAPPIPPEGPLALFKGVGLNVLREAPNMGLLMAGFNFLTRQAVGFPFINANDPNMKFFLMIPSGILAMSSGSILKVPVIDMSKQVQAGLADNAFESFKNVYLTPPPKAVLKKLGTLLTVTVLRGAPFGAFQCLIYELLKDKTPVLLENAGFPIAGEPFLWGACAGFCTGFLTNPPDVILTRMSVSQQEDDGKDFDLGAVLGQIKGAAEKVYAEEGWGGFAKGGLENAFYYAPEAMVWFGAYEALKGVTESWLQ